MDQFVPAVIAFHRAFAVGDYQAALHHATIARDTAPCDGEASRWALNVSELEVKNATTVQKLFIGLGFSRNRILRDVARAVKRETARNG